MRVLCLHGSGTSGRIMEQQFKDFCNALDDGYEYVFLDGELETSKAKCTDLVPGPYFCWFKSLEPQAMKEACDYLEYIMEAEGPFDGIIAFSQGASVAISYLMHLEISQPHKLLPVRWAIFFSSMVGVSPDPTFMEKEIAAFAAHSDPRVLGLWEEKPAARLPGSRIGLVKDSNKKALAAEMFDLIRCNISAAHGNGQSAAVKEIESSIRSGTHTTKQFPRIYHPLAVTQRLRIPTVHVVGKSDTNFLKQARLVKKLCAKDMSAYVEHSGAHDVPRKASELAQVVAAAERAIMDSRFVSLQY